MRVAFDVRLTAYTQGGIARYMRQLAHHLPIVAPQHDYWLLHARKDTSPLPLPRTRAKVCYTPCHHRLERLALTAELLPLHPDVLHCADFIVPRGGAWRAVSTIHDLAFLEYTEFLTADSRRYYSDQIVASCERADAIITVSEATRQAVLSHLNLPAEKVTTIYSGVATRFCPQPAATIAALRERWQLPADYLLFVGTFEPRKNITGLLRGYARLRQDSPQPPPPLVLVGNRGWLFAQTQHVMQSLDLSHHILFITDFPDADLPALYSAARALLLVSHTEGFGFPVLEAYACGVPAVLAQRGALPEVGGDLAWYCDPNDPNSIAAALYALLQEPLADRAQQRLDWASQFSWSKTAEKTAALYAAV